VKIILQETFETKHLDPPQGVPFNITQHDLSTTATSLQHFANILRTTFCQQPLNNIQVSSTSFEKPSTNLNA
jgi:hypothetical protein